MLSLESGVSAVKFGAVWCGPCRIVDGNLKRMAAEFPKVRFLSVDVDDFPHEAKDYHSRSVPTVILFRDGHEIERLVGAIHVVALRKSFRDATKDIAA